MNMKTIKVSEATGPALNWLVAQCEMMREDYRDRGLLVHRIGYGQPMPPYSTDPAQAHPIIDREGIDLDYWPDGGYWQATSDTYDSFGPTKTIAAMRCYVSSKLGETAEVPQELIGESQHEHEPQQIDRPRG
jgi:hypothetical protein